MIGEQTPYIRWKTKDGMSNGEQLFPLPTTGDLVRPVGKDETEGMVAELSTALEREMNFTLKR